MRNLFTAIYNALITVNNMQYVRMWNNQIELVQSGQLEMIPFPSAFIAFDTATIEQLGEGRQRYDPLYIDIHIAYWQMDAGDGTFEQNLDVFDFKQLVFAALQKLQPGIIDDLTPCGSLIRVSEIQDYSHAGVYHFIQRYKTTYIEQLMGEPVGGSEFDPTQDTYTSGLLVVGNWYQILDVSGGSDFTNVGATSNTIGVIFQATGTTPTSWGTGMIEDNFAKVDYNIITVNEIHTVKQPPL